MLKIGIVGCGYWGPNLVRNFYETNRCKLVICDLDSNKLARIKMRYPAVDTTQDFNTLIDSSIDGIVVSTPINTHFELGKKALEAGKHVLIEKPLTTSSNDAAALIDIVEKKGLILMVGHTFEFSPSVIKVREIIKQGILGQIFFISSLRVNLGIHQKDVSVLWDLGPHDFSILFNWLDEIPARVSAVGKDCIQKGIPDVAFINLEFASGILAHCQISWLAPSKLRDIIIIGTEKMLVYDDAEVNEKVKIYDKGVNFHDPETFGEYHLSYRMGDIVSPKLETYEPLFREVNHFLDCIETGKKPITDGYCGLRVVKALEAAEKSLKNGGKCEII